MPDGTFRAAFDQDLAFGVALGTRIETQAGECRVERLREGDQLMTVDGGLVTLRSITKSSHRASGTAAPIRILHGGIGNHRDLTVAPDQLMSVGEAFIAARALVGHGIAEIAFGGMTQYYSLGFDEDTTFFAEGAPMLSSKADWRPHVQQRRAGYRVTLI